MDEHEAIKTLHNGNISKFKDWLNKATKLQILRAIECAAEDGLFGRKEIINKMWIYLKD